MNYEITQPFISIKTPIGVVNCSTSQYQHSTFIFSKKEVSFKGCLKKIIFEIEEVQPKIINLNAPDGYYFKINGKTAKSCCFIITKPCFIVFEKKMFSSFFTIKDFDRACSIPSLVEK